MLGLACNEFPQNIAHVSPSMTQLRCHSAHAMIGAICKGIAQASATWASCSWTKDPGSRHNVMRQQLASSASKDHPGSRDGRAARPLGPEGGDSGVLY